jgi:hypothetical protein
MSENNGTATKTPTSFRLSEPARRLLVVLADDTGLSQAGVVEMALRDLAKARQVEYSAEDTK